MVAGHVDRGGGPLRGRRAARPGSRMTTNHAVKTRSSGSSRFSAKRVRAGDDDGWARTIALADAVKWMESEALVVNRRRETTALRPERADVLRRFFAYMEQVIADPACRADQGWIMVELFEGIPWVEDVIEFLGPDTAALLREAQDGLARYSGWIGNWGQ